MWRVKLTGKLCSGAATGAGDRCSAPGTSQAMSTLAFLLTQTVNALSQAALLFFLGVGLTLIFGIMRIVNFAHGTLYMLGAFIGYSLTRWTGNFWLALVGAPLIVGLFGATFELGILRRLYRRDAH